MQPAWFTSLPRAVKCRHYPACNGLIVIANASYRSSSKICTRLLTLNLRHLRPVFNQRAIVSQRIWCEVPKTIDGDPFFSLRFRDEVNSPASIKTGPDPKPEKYAGRKLRGGLEVWSCAAA